MLLCVAMLFASCENSSTDDNGGGNGGEIEEVTPQWPEAIEADVLAGETYTLTIEPNVDWVLSIPESMAAYFQIQDGENQVYTLRGKKGEHKVTINISNTEDFDLDRTCEVSLTMKGETRIIATLTKSKKERELKIYAAQVDEGAFVYESDSESALTFAYESEDMTANASATMFWPEGMGSYMARVKVESNFEWMVDGVPTWITPIKNGEAGTTELWLQGAAAYYPMEASTATLSFVAAANSEVVMATMEVSIPSAKDIFMAESFSAESIFNYVGDFYNASIDSYIEGGKGRGSITAIDGAQVCAVAFSEQVGVTVAEMNPAWVTISIDEWDATDASLIQRRYIEYGVTTNNDAARQAYLFVIPADVEADLNSICEREGDSYTGNITEAYKPYMVTTISQSETPGNIEMLQAAMFADTGGQFERLPSGSYVSTLFPDVFEAYSILFINLAQNESDSALLKIAREVTSVAYYYFADESGKLTAMTGEESWLNLTYSAEGSRITMSPDKSTATSYGPTKCQEGYITLADEQGVFAAIRCIYNPNAKVELPALKFYSETGAKGNGSTLVRLTEGELFTTYNQKYPGTNIYHLTFTSARPNLSMLTGLYNTTTEMPYNCIFDNEDDRSWLGFEAATEYQMITMKADVGNGKTGALVFLNSEGKYNYVLVCTLNIAQ